MLDLRKSIEEIVGRDAVVTALQRLAPATQAAFTDITAVSWVPLDALTDIVDEVARVARVNPERMIDDAVRRAVERTLKTVWRVMLRFTTDAALVARTPVMYSMSRNVGHLTAQVVSPGVAEIALSRWPGAPSRQVRLIGISMVTVVTLAGRQDVAITSTPTPDGANFRMTWRV